MSKKVYNGKAYKKGLMTHELRLPLLGWERPGDFGLGILGKMGLGEERELDGV